MKAYEGVDFLNSPPDIATEIALKNKRSKTR